jgi:hypothetical protein
LLKMVDLLMVGAVVEERQLGNDDQVYIAAF